MSEPLVVNEWGWPAYDGGIKSTHEGFFVWIGPDNVSMLHDDNPAYWRPMTRADQDETLARRGSA